MTSIVIVVAAACTAAAGAVAALRQRARARRAERLARIRRLAAIRTRHAYRLQLAALRRSLLAAWDDVSAARADADRWAGVAAGLVRKAVAARRERDEALKEASRLRKAESRLGRLLAAANERITLLEAIAQPLPAPQLEGTDLEHAFGEVTAGLDLPDPGRSS